MCSSTNFSNIPKDIQFRIFDQANTVHVRAVCKSWKTVFSTLQAIKAFPELKTILYECNLEESSTLITIISMLFQAANKAGAKEDVEGNVKTELPLHRQLIQIHQETEEKLVHAYATLIKAIGIETENPQELSSSKEMRDLLKNNSDLVQTLTCLKIQKQKIKILPEEIAVFQALTELNLAYNNITVLPEIGSLLALSKLSLANNQLTMLPSEIGDLQNLTKLSLTKNCFSEFPEEICNLQSLLSLSFMYNTLTTLSPKIGNLQVLEELDLGCNQIKTLPAEIGNLWNLSKFNLQYNKLTTLPPEIGDLPNLIDLNLSYNYLTTLPPELVKLNIFPNIYGNPITYLPSQLISKAPEKYQNYAFDLSADIQILQDFQNGKILLDGMPIRLQNLVNQSADIQLLLSKMHELDKLKVNFLSSKSVEVLWQILEFSTEGLLHEQQIVEVAVELFNKIEDENPLKESINAAVAKAFGLDLQKNPQAGLEKFLFRPLDPKVKEAVSKTKIKRTSFFTKFFSREAN